MASLFGRNLKEVYGNLLQIETNGAGIDVTERVVEDGLGNTTPLLLSTDMIRTASGYDMSMGPDDALTTKLYVDNQINSITNWIYVQFLSTNTGAQNLALFDAAVAEAYANNNKRLYITSDGSECEIDGTLSLSGHDFTNDSNGYSGLNAVGFIIWWDNVILKIPASPTFSNFHECKSPEYNQATVSGFSGPDGNGEYTATYANAADVVRLYEDGTENEDEGSPGNLLSGQWGISGTTVYIKDNPAAKVITVAAPQEGYRSLNEFTITDQIFNDEVEAPIIDSSGNPVPYACFWDQRGTGGSTGPGAVHFGSLTLKGNEGQDNKLVAIGTSQQGFDSDDGRRCTWACKLILDGWQVAIYGTPRFGFENVNNDGFADCITRNTFLDLEVVASARAFVLGANKADAAKMVAATLEYSHTSWIQQTGLGFNTLRVNHRPATQAVPAVEMESADIVVTEKCYVRNNGQNALNDGAAYFFRTCNQSKLEITDLQFDNNDMRTGFEELIYIGESYNGNISCPTAYVHISNHFKNRGRVNALVKIQADENTRERQLISHGLLPESDVLHVAVEGSASTRDNIEIRQKGQWKIYEINNGAINEVFNLAKPLDIIQSYNYNGTIAVAPVSNATDSLAIGDGASATDFNTVAIGVEASCSVGRSVAIGPQSSSIASAGIAIGRNALAGATESIAIGGNTNVSQFTDASGDGSIAIGRQANVSSGATNSVAIGREALCTMLESVSLGNNAESAGIEAIAVGNNSDALGDYSIAIGSTADADAASGEGAIAIGWNADANGENSIAIGSNSTSHLSARADDDKSIAIGNAKTRAPGEIVHGIQGKGNNDTDAQRNERTESTFILNQLATTSSITELYTTDNATSNGVIDIDANTGFAFEAMIYAQGVNPNGVDRAIWKFDYGLIVRNTGGNPSLDVISPSGTAASPDSSNGSGSGWTVDIDVETVGDYLRFRFTSGETKDIIVRAVVKGTFISFDPT